MTITIKTYNEILGDMIRKILPNTPLNDINNGSVLLTLLEAAATSDFDNNSAVLSLLELLSIDALRNNDLDARAADYGISRIAAQKSTGYVSVKDSTISKRSTGLYSVKPAPIAGSTVIYVNDASLWNPTGNLYIGRGTQSFEGPIAYTSIVNNGSFFTVTLASALQKDHLSSDTVVDQQGKLDRVIPAGTIVLIPANNQNPEIRFSVLRTTILPAGEDTVNNVPIICQKAGSIGNAGIGTIVQFASPPFLGATVSNTTALSDGRDVETDVQLRERLKAYANTLARGTNDAILAAVIGVADSEENKQVQSAIIQEPPKTGDPSIVYIDDGSGFQPSYAGQPVDILLNSASGNEEFLQLANYPLPRPQAVNTLDGPFELIDGMHLNVYVDGIEESVTFNSSQFRNISAATLPEIVIAINDASDTNFKCRLSQNSTRLLLYPTAFDAETIQVVPIRDTDDPTYWANNVFRFPTNKFSYISLYRNNELLKEKEVAASLTTLKFSDWGITTTGNLALSVDGTPIQDQTFTVADFGGQPINTATVNEWVNAINAKFAGLTAAATSSGAIQLTSNRLGINSKLEIFSCSYFAPMFGQMPTQSVGQNSDFQLNRQTGNLRILSGISAGDSISAGATDTKGSIASSVTTTGTYSLSPDGSSRPTESVIVVDSTLTTPRTGLSLTIGTTITFSEPTTNTMRIMSSALDTFASLQPHDYIYIANRGDTDGTGAGTWADIKNCGLYRIKAKGSHTIAGTDSYVDVTNIDVVAGSYAVLASEDIQAFSAQTYPQLWQGKNVTNPALATTQNIVNELNNDLANVKASIFKTTSIRTTSTTETDGSIASPVSIGNAKQIFPTGVEQQLGNPSHIANRLFNKDCVSGFKRSIPTEQNVFLGRHVNTDVTGALLENTTPALPNEPYSEVIRSAAFDPSLTQSDDQIVFNKGSNKGHYRSIKDMQASNRIGTQQNLPRTLFDHATTDEITVMKSLAFSPDDNIVFILDQNSVDKTVVVPMSRTGRVHTLFPPSNQSCSAYDQDNEPGITFDSLQVWGKTINNTEFKDYAIWFRARNWYASGGAGSGGGSFIVRAKEYGPHGENLRFRIEHPTFPNTAALVKHNNFPDHTEAKYFFGSGAPRAIGIGSGLQFDVTSLGNDQYRYTFLGFIDLSTVVAGDVVGIASTSGVSSDNMGSFSILNKGANYIDVYNPNGSVTGVGLAEQTKISCVNDVVGTPAQHTIATVADVGGNLHQKYFTLYDDVGQVAFWYDVNNTGAVAPVVPGAYRYVRIANVVTGDSANTVAAKTNIIVDLDLKFNSLVVSNSVFVTNDFNGPTTAGTAGTSGFTVTQTVNGVADTSVNGKHFIVYDAAGSVAVWYDTTGTTPEPFHGADRSIRVGTVIPGDLAAIVASKTAAILSSDPVWSTSVSGSDVTITDSAVGGRASPQAGTSGFTMTTVINGSDVAPETITLITGFNIFPLITNSVQEIVDTINTSSVLTAAATSTTSLLINKATREEVYVPAGPSDYSASLAYGHDPDPISGYNEYVQFYDSHTWVKSFQNSGPNFIFKTNLVLQGASTVYNMGSAPNPDTSDLGELFKLIPVTLQNVHHHFTQKALSQLPIVANVNIANAFRSIQITSKQLGSAGSVEIVGGRANAAEFSIFGDAQNVNVSGHEFAEVKIAASPFTLNIGDYVTVESTNAVKRLSRLSVADSLDVAKIGDNAEYRFNSKLSLTGAINVTITDVSASYGRTGTGMVWRWAFSGGTFISVNAGDLVLAYNLPGGWSVGNAVRPTGDRKVSGLPIIAVDAVAKTIDIVNPTGVAMGTTAIGAGTIDIVPTPIIKWELRHDTTTKYRIEKLGFNDLFRLRAVSGTSPQFFSCGVAVDDLMVISGLTFLSNNNGKFRVLAVTDDHIVFQNARGLEELNYTRPFSPTDTAVQWTANSNIVTGATGSFSNVSVGDWVKKPDDDESYYVQVLINSGTQLTLGSNYQGTTSQSKGIAYDQVSGVDAGRLLQDVDDIVIYEGDSVQTMDQIFVDDIVDTNWFNILNTGVFEITQWGFTSTYKPFVRVANKNAVAQSNVLMAVSVDGVYLIEGADNATVMIKEVRHTTIDEFDPTRRIVYLMSSGMSYKMAQTNGTTLKAMGKLSFDTGVTTGIDGYLYYTGLLRKVQRVIDGYEPDATNFPGRRAVGGVIELLPPLIKRIQVALNVTTNEGVNLNEISNDISSAIIRYVNSLGVGQDVIMAEIIVRVMAIKGVATVTFTYPAPSNASIAVADFEKAFIEVQDISIA